VGAGTTGGTRTTARCKIGIGRFNRSKLSRRAIDGCAQTKISAEASRNGDQPLSTLAIE
jgi:hypothetical protein